MAGARLRSVRRLWRGQGAHAAGDARRACPLGDDARRGNRARRPDDRDGARMDVPRELPPGEPGSAFPPLGASVELPCSARARAPRPARHCAGRTVCSDQAEGGVMDELVRAIEAPLFASAEPLRVEEIAEHVGEGEIEIALGQLSAHYEGRGIELVERGGRWHFQTAPDLAHLLRREREESRRLSRAAVETLAISALQDA